MKQIIYISLFIIVFILLPITISAQELDFEKMLVEDVENVNPVYKPVVSFGLGYLSFYGNIKNNNSNPLSGNMAWKINMNTYIDQQRYFKLNFNITSTYILPLPLTVEQRSPSIPQNNYNFQSDLLMMGAGVLYDFGHFIKKSPVRPFVAVGLEYLSFNTKTDLIGNYYDPTDKKMHNSQYYYWSDGTIRNRPQSDERQAYLVERDYKYETDIQTSVVTNPNGVKYNQYTVAIPIEAGLDFSVTNRTTLRLGYAYRYTFSPYIDGNNNGSNDAFGYTYLSLHFDLFSDPKILRNKLLFLDISDSYDQDLIEDEDNDGILDINDHCLHTPKGVPVDTVGCPLDADNDGVPDYLDKQAGTPAGAIVDKNGVEIPDAQIWENLDMEALPREQVALYISAMNNLGSGSSRRLGKVEIPQKFKSLDADGDGYISFDEVLKAIDSFFDFDSDLSTQDIYELNDFFFSQ